MEFHWTANPWKSNWQLPLRLWTAPISNPGSEPGNLGNEFFPPSMFQTLFLDPPPLRGEEADQSRGSREERSTREVVVVEGEVSSEVTRASQLGKPRVSSEVERRTVQWRKFQTRNRLLSAGKLSTWRLIISCKPDNMISVLMDDQVQCMYTCLLELFSSIT